MGKLEAVIFDWAGTTVDFGCFAPVQAFLEAFGSVGINPTLEEVRKPMGMLKRDHVRTMLSMDRIAEQWKQVHGRPWNEADVEEVYLKSEKGILDMVGNYAAPKPFVLDAVRELREMGIRIGSTTGYTDQMMEIVAPRAKELGYQPDVWFSPDSTGKVGRPYPYMIFRNMESLKVSATSKVIKVGDTVSDILEGKNAGILSVGIVEGSSVMGLSQEEFRGLTPEQYQEAYQKAESIYREAGADRVIANMKDLIGLIQKLEV